MRGNVDRQAPRAVAAPGLWFRLGAAVALTALLALSAQGAAEAGQEPKKSAALELAALPPLDPALQGAPLDPAWPKQLFVVVDSVLLGAKPNLIKSLPDWQVTVAGRPALMISKAVSELRQRKGSIGPVAVVGLGYNTLWQKNRKNFPRWAERFDRSVEDMLALLKERGARKIVWVLLRELTPDQVPGGGVAVMQYHKYSWYFPYVNERLRAIKARHPEMALADWATAARRTGVTYDAIHLNPRGADLMVKVVKAAIGIGAPAAASPVLADAAIKDFEPQRARPPQRRLEVAQADTPTLKDPPPQPVEQQPAVEQQQPVEPEQPHSSEPQLAVPAKKPSYRSRRLGMFALSQIDFATVVMLGDSLTERAQWSEITGCPYVANRGIGGDQSGGVLRRLDDVIKLKPAAIFLMIGINDILSNVPTETIVSNVQHTIETLSGAGTHVYLTLALPTAANVSHRFNPKVAELNAAYRKLAVDLPHVSLVDFVDKVQNPEGFLRDEFSVDGIHLSPRGYRVWRDAIRPYVLGSCQPRSSQNLQNPTEFRVQGPPPQPQPQLQAKSSAPTQPVAQTQPLESSPDDITGSIPAERPLSARGVWMIQIGAFPELDEAQEKIREAQNLGKDVVANAKPFTEKVVSGGEQRYRARFAGFDKHAAESACNYFKRNNIDCLIVRD